MTFRSTVAVLVLAAGLASPAFAGGDGDLGLYSTTRAFDEVKTDVEDAIINRGYVIDYHGYIGNMLKRTAGDTGGTKPLYKDAEFYQFCSANLSRKMMEADPRNIGFCPYVIMVYEEASKPGTVQVSFRRPAIVGSDASKSALTVIDKLLDEIASEATQ